jgi:hypothetical protein
MLRPPGGGWPAFRLTSTRVRGKCLPGPVCALPPVTYPDYIVLTMRPAAARP